MSTAAVDKENKEKSAVNSFFKKKKATTTTTKFKGFKVVPPSITSNSTGSVTIVHEGDELPSSGTIIKNKKKDDEWVEDEEDDEPVGLFFTTSEVTTKVAEIKESEDDAPTPEIHEIMAAEAAKQEFWNSRKVAKAPKAKPVVEEKKPITSWSSNWKDREAQKSTASLSSEASFPSLIKSDVVASTVNANASANCWSTLIVDDGEDEKELEEDKSPVVVAVTTESPSKKDKKNKKVEESSIEKEEAENKAIEDALKEAKNLKESEPVVVDPRFANKKKKKRVKKEDSDDDE